MGITVQTGVSALTVFVQGALSFLSPCVLPLLPLYMSYLAGGTGVDDGKGGLRYPRRRVFVNTLFFVLGISFAFFLLGMGLSALGSFFRDYQVWFARVSGLIIILFGLYQLGLGKRAMLLEREHRLPFRLDKAAMNPVTALVLGFTFSFAWTPCVGPALSSVLLMASSSGSAAAGFALIGLYTLGFALPFLAVGLFTGAVLNFFRRRQSIVRWTVKLGGVLLIVMGVMTIAGASRGTSAGQSASAQSQQESQTAAAAPDFTLTDQFGQSHTLSDYQGKVVFLNFWATWCGPCRSEMPDIQALYEAHGGNAEDLVVLGVAQPGVGSEGSREDIAAFLAENGYTYPVVMDEDGSVFARYGIRAFPTTFMISSDGTVYGYVEGALSAEIMDDIVRQTVEAES
ncbi:cytochrome c biogenesis protein CcdA [uncultured Oscillibacter sp.]|uniref:redoxin domain-containing protein n=1 Tax=uncultured Oscillibacter sp. TaxID=876091 RepID=UPI0025F15713|nr:cytochrome c biogenesis protein CcdA [uncultured Oscillibacter sp.]